MPNESGVVVCPNPKCHKKIEEAILLNNLSTTSAEQYYACPHCFIKLDVISARPQKQEEEKKKKEMPLLEVPRKEEKNPLRCAGYLGYLACLPKNKPIPKECLICPKVLDCAMETSEF